jgi:predicted O-methyltransferase YrrM
MNRGDGSVPHRPRATDPELWKRVDEFVASHMLPEDPALTGALARSASAGLPSIQVTPAQGKFLHLLTRAVSAKRALEIGTLGGYSAIWLARAVGTEGTVVTLERDPHHAEVARTNLQEAGVGSRVDVRVGDARETLPRLASEHPAPFDFVFIDADRPHYDEYLEWAVRLGRAGTLIVVDNVVKEGAVLDPATVDPGMAGLRRFTERLGTDPRLAAIEIQTVGSKGHDGFALALVTHLTP